MIQIFDSSSSWLSNTPVFEPVSVSIIAPTALSSCVSSTTVSTSVMLSTPVSPAKTASSVSASPVSV